MSGKRAWPPPRSRRPSTAAETSGGRNRAAPALGKTCRPAPHRLSARARRRVPAVRERDPHRVATGEPQRGGARLRRSVSRPGALAERLSATGYRRPLEADNRFAARQGRVNFRQTLWLVGAGHHEHPVAGHPVAAGEDAGRHAGTRLVSDVPCTIPVRPGHGRQNRGAHVTQDLLLGWALSRPPIIRGQGGPGVGQVRAAPRCPLEGRLGMPTEQLLNAPRGLLGRPRDSDRLDQIDDRERRPPVTLR